MLGVLEIKLEIKFILIYIVHLSALYIYIYIHIFHLHDILRREEKLAETQYGRIIYRFISICELCLQLENLTSYK